jgi:hypothetical protein
MPGEPPKRSAPPPPQRPVLPPESPKQRGSIWSVLIAGIVGLAMFVGLIFLAGALGPIVLGVGMILGAVYVIACLHYLLWGRWLGDAIRQEVEEEETHEKSDARKSKFE